MAEITEQKEVVKIHRHYSKLLGKLEDDLKRHYNKIKNTTSKEIVIRYCPLCKLPDVQYNRATETVSENYICINCNEQINPSTVSMKIYFEVLKNLKHRYMTLTKKKEDVKTHYPVE